MGGYNLIVSPPKGHVQGNCITVDSNNRKGENDPVQSICETRNVILWTGK